MIRGKEAIHKLFADPKKEATRYFRKTGLFPVNHVMIIRSQLLERNPWIATSLFDAFSRSKDLCLRRNREMAFEANSYVWLDLLCEDLIATFGPDPFPYGFKKNEKMLDTITQYSYEQGLTPSKIHPSELFFSSTLDT
jgi:4,5-dihydroxyphthalate decarboxylase